MARISINLLPPEITTRELKRVKFYKIQAIGVGIVLTMIFLTSLTLALQILQNRNISLYKAKVAQAEQRVSEMKDTQASLILLKDRLTVINKYFGVLSKQSSMYKLLTKLSPASVEINTITVDKGGSTVLLVLVPDAVTLDNLMNNLLTKETNEDAISRVTIDNLSRGRDGVYRLSLKVAPK